MKQVRKIYFNKEGFNMHYHVYCKEKVISENYKAAISEFEKRLSAYCDIHIHESLTLSFPKETSKTNHHFLFLKEGSSTYSSEEFCSFFTGFTVKRKINGSCNYRIFGRRAL